MSLLQFQAALVRVYLDVRVRKAVRAGDRVPLAEFGLSELEFEDVRLLLFEQADQVELFAKTLMRKREERLGSFYPLLKMYVGEAAWTTYCAEYCAAMPTPPQPSDAIGFASFFRDAFVPTEGEDEGIFKDLIEFESTKAAIASTPKGSRQQIKLRDSGPLENLRPLLIPPACLRILGRDPRRLSDWVRLGATRPANIDTKPVPVLFFPLPNSTDVGISQVGPWLGELLKRADGTATLGELVKALDSPFDRAVILSAVWESLTKLSASGILELLPQKGNAL